MGLLIVTGVKIQKLWKYRSDPQMREAHMGSGQGSLKTSVGEGGH
jgi:hypothetical protein